MFPFLFRIGPVFIPQIVFMVIGISQVLIEDFLPCYGYTFVELSLQLFLIEMVIVLRLINKNKDLRKKYISNLVFGTRKYYCQRMVWNTFSIGFIIISLAYWMISEGLNLSNSQSQDAQKIFTLYPLCFFSNVANHPENHDQLRMVLNFLYACNVIMNLLLITLNIRSFYYYAQKIDRNRKFFVKNAIQLSESLIDCEIINQSLTQPIMTSKNYQEVDCGICLRKFCGQKVIRLRCSHHFHQQCIILWLERKDECPYRCI